jgi:hypothetical protein
MSPFLEISGETDINRVRAITSRLAMDPRYVPIMAAFREVEALVRAGDFLRALDFENRGRQRYLRASQSAKWRGMRSSGESEGRIFNPTRYLNTLTSDRGAAMARMMQADKQALEGLVSESARPKEFVIELTGDYERDESLMRGSPQRPLGVVQVQPTPQHPLHLPNPPNDS